MSTPSQQQAQLLLQLGAYTQEQIEWAYQQTLSQAHLDVCAVLQQHGQLTADQAEQIRRQLLVTPAPASVLGSVPGSSSRPMTASVNEQGQLEQIGDYKIIDKIAAGGMGAVYHAHSLKLKIDVALKTLIAGKLASPEAIRRFQLEAEATARLNHPNIVKVHDIGQVEGQHFLVMDLIEGPSLKSMITDQGPMEPRQAALFAKKLASALAYAHARSILHRDVKPANVLVRTEDQEPMLTDFGLAKDESEDSGGLTVSGAMVGTPQYMPPEQADGDLQAIDRRADVYSLGATLYEMLTAEPVFTGATITNIIKAVMTNEPRAPSSLVSGIPRQLEIICLKCLEKAPEKRYVTAKELAADLERFLNDEPIKAQPPSLSDRMGRWGRRHRGAILGVLGVLMAAAVGAGAVNFQARRQRELQALSRGALKATAERQFQERVTDTVQFFNEQMSGLEARLKQATPNFTESERVSAMATLTERSEWLAKPESFQQQVRRACRSAAGEHFQSEFFEQSWQQQWRGLERTVLEAQVLYLKGLIEFLSGQKQAALKAWSQAYRLNPSGDMGARAGIQLAQSLERDNRLLRAESILARFSWPGYHKDLRRSAQRLRAHIALRFGQFDKAWQLYENTADWPWTAKEQAERQLARQLAGQSSIKVDGRWALSGFAKGPAIVSQRLKEPRLMKRLLRLQYSDGALRVRDRLTLAPGQALKHSCSADGAHYALLGKQGDGLWGRMRVLRLGAEPSQDQVLGSLSLEKTELLKAVGDANGDGRLDVVLLSGTKRVTLVLSAFQGPAQRISLQPRQLSAVTSVAFVDFDGNGCEELALGLGGYSHYRLRAFESQPQGSKLDCVFDELIGTATDFMRRDEGGKDALYVRAERHWTTDNPTLFDFDFTPERPDAIWRVALEESDSGGHGLKGRLRLQRVADIDFELRHRYSFRHQVVDFGGLLAKPAQSLGYVRGDDLTYALNNATYSGGFLCVRLAPGHECAIEFPRSLDSYACCDVDGDGDDELVVKFGPRAWVYGLKAVRDGLAKDESAGGEVRVSPPSALEVIQDMLESGSTEAGRSSLEALIDGGQVSLNVRSQARLLLAESYFEEGRAGLERGLEQCRLVVHEDLRWGDRALMRMARSLEKWGRRQEAVKALQKRLRLFEVDKDQVFALETRIQQLKDLDSRREVLSFRRAQGFSQESLVEVTEPWNARVTKRGLELHSDSSDNIVVWPLIYRGGSVCIRAKLRVLYCDFAQFMSIEFGQKGGVANTLLQLSILSRGGGDEESFQRFFAAATGPSWKFNRRRVISGVPKARLLVRRFDPELVFDIEVSVDPVAKILRTRVRYGDELYESRIHDRHSLNYGDYNFGLRANALDGRHGYARFVVEDLVLEGVGGRLKVSQHQIDKKGSKSQRLPLIEASSFMCQGKDKAALASCESFLAALAEEPSGARPTAWRDGDWERALFMKALLCARLGQEARGFQVMTALQQRLGSGVWGECGQHLAGMTELERRFLAGFYAREKGVETRSQMQRRYQSLMSSGAMNSKDWAVRSGAMSELGLLLTWGEQRSIRVTSAGGVWNRLGDYRRAESSFKGPGLEARVQAGYMAYKGGDYKAAHRYWSSIPDFGESRSTRWLRTHYFRVRRAVGVSQKGSKD